MFPAEENRASVLGEYGGLGLKVNGHVWQEDSNWGYGGLFETPEALFSFYNNQNREMRALIEAGLSAAVYTQTTDVEIELNGFMTYDRAVIKFPVDEMRKSNESLRLPAPEVKVVVPCSKTNAQKWSYTFEKPADNWAAVDFDASAWKVGEAGDQYMNWKSWKFWAVIAAIVIAIVGTVLFFTTDWFKGILVTVLFSVLSFVGGAIVSYFFFPKK